MYKNEKAYKEYLIENGMGQHSACGYIANIKKLIDPTIKMHINPAACSLLDEDVKDVVDSYADAIKNNPILIELNQKSHRHMSAPVSRYAQFLEERGTTKYLPQNVRSREQGGFIRDISVVENEISVFKKYNHQVPEQLLKEYNHLLLENRLVRIEELISKELNGGDFEIEFLVRYDKKNGVRLFPQTGSRPQIQEVDTQKEHSSKSEKTNFTVTFPDGFVIKEKTAKECFVKTIIRIGIDRIVPLGLQFYTMPLLGTKKSDHKVYASGQVEVRPGLFLMTSGPTDRKIKILKEIDSLLYIGLEVESE